MIDYRAENYSRLKAATLSSVLYLIFQPFFLRTVERTYIKSATKASSDILSAAKRKLMNFKESVDAAKKSDEGEERNEKIILNCGKL
jgi:hypothetical protein